MADLSSVQMFVEYAHNMCSHIAQEASLHWDNAMDGLKQFEEAHPLLKQIHRSWDHAKQKFGMKKPVATAVMTASLLVVPMASGHAPIDHARPPLRRSMRIISEAVNRSYEIREMPGGSAPVPVI